MRVRYDGSIASPESQAAYQGGGRGLPLVLINLNVTLNHVDEDNPIGEREVVEHSRSSPCFGAGLAQHAVDETAHRNGDAPKRRRVRLKLRTLLAPAVLVVLAILREDRPFKAVDWHELA